MVTDLILNIVSEIIGIALTVFLVDKMLEKREKKRWAPSKNILYGRLIEFIDTLMPSVVPITTPSVQTYYFFDEVFEVCIEHKLDFESFQGKENLKEAISLELAVLGPDEKKRIANRLFELGKDLDTILTSGMVLFEPELLSLLFELKQNLRNMDERRRPSNVESDDFPRPKDYIDLFAIAVCKIAVNAYNVKAYLKAKTTQIKTMEEMMKELFDASKNSVS